MTAADLHKALCAGAAALALTAGAAFGTDAAHPAAGPRSTVSDDRAPELWRNIRVGMTLAEVRKLVPESHAPGEPDSLISGAARAALETAGSLQGRPSQVRFYFTNHDELLGVVETMKDRALSFDDVSKLVQEISARQGLAQDCNLGRDALFDGCSWIGRSLTITMFAGVMPEKLRADHRLKPGFVTLNYMSTAYYRATYKRR